MPRPRAAAPDRRSLLKGFALGTVLSAAAAASVVVVVLRGEDEQRMLGEAVSAHLRSLQADHLTDVLSSDQHTVKPWFNGRIDVRPPVVDLTAQGFTLIGGRLDYIDGKPVRRSSTSDARTSSICSSPRRWRAAVRAELKSIQGFNIRRWSEQGLELLAISDINADELQEFADKFQAALRAGA